MLNLLISLILFTLHLTAEESTSEFDRLMGQGTEHFQHVYTEEDKAFFKTCETLYEKNKSLRFTESKKAKIPHIVHFIWLGPRPFPPESVENVRNWIAHHPDWRFFFWTDQTREAPCHGMEVQDAESFPFLFLRHCYAESKNWGEKSDVLRFEILYQKGGVYVDHDANCLRSFDSLARGYDLFCGLETPHPAFAGYNITAGNGLLGTVPFHPVISRVIENIGKDWASLGKKYPGIDAYSQNQLVMERTYIQLTNALKMGIEEDGNADIIFPAAYFFAKKDIPSLYSKHFYATAWKDEDKGSAQFEKVTRRTLCKMKRRSDAIRWIGRGALIINLLALTILLFYYLRKKRGYS